MSKNRFGVYIHFPFCRKRCPYCDFAVFIRKEIPHEQYRDAILQELEEKKKLFENRSLTSIYFGGGTPSLWRMDCLTSVVNATFSAFPPQISKDQVEITLECDPLDLLEAPIETLVGLQEIGINRLSVGVQSFQEQHLNMLGRLHTASQARDSIARAQTVGFKNISLDLIIGVPHQTEEQLLADLKEVVRLETTHVSLYQLTVEPGTALAFSVQRKKVVMPLLEEQAFFYQKVQEVLKEFGFEQYEISSYAKKNGNLEKTYRSGHNQLYWTLEEYAGLGVSAHSFRRFVDGSGERFSNPRSLSRYYQKIRGDHEKKSISLLSSIQQDDSIYEYRSKEDLAREALWLGLRQMKGILIEDFISKFGINPILFYQKELDLLQNRGWIEINPSLIRLTEQGILFADEVGSYLV